MSTTPAGNPKPGKRWGRHASALSGPDAFVAIDRLVATVQPLGLAYPVLGLANQMFSLFTTAGLVTLSLSGLIMWRRRKPEGVLGAPVAVRRVRFSYGLITLMVILGIHFPFLKGSMILVGLAEKFVLRRIPATQRWLGLHAATARPTDLNCFLNVLAEKRGTGRSHTHTTARVETNLTDAPIRRSGVRR